MDESDDDLVWSNASDQISSSDSDRIPTKMNESLDDSDLERKCKEELRQELFIEPKLENGHEVSTKKKKKNKEKLNLSVKSEPESDLDSVKRKKSKRKSSINDSHEETNDDSYLELCVKKEAAVSHKKEKIVEYEGVLQNSDTHSESALEHNSEKEKKKKKKKHKYKDEEQDDSVVKELFSAEETFVGTLEVEDDNNAQQKKKKKKRNKKRDNSPFPQTSHSGHEEDSIVGADVTDHATIVDETHNEVEHSSKKSNASTISPKKQRQSRILDRIQFEDDSQIETVQYNGRRSSESFKLQQFLKLQGNLEPVDINYPEEVSISSDDEVFLLNCPTEVEIAHLKDITLSLQNSCKLKLGGQKYESIMDSVTGNNVTLLLFENQKHKIKSFPCKGIFNIRKRLPKAHFVMDNVLENEQTNFIPLPETKCRHPLFGPNYKNAIKLPAAVKERLQNEAAREEVKSHERKKKKKKKQMEIDYVAEDEGDQKPEKGKERRKRRRSSRGDDTPSSKRARAPPTWDDEQAIEHNLFDF